MSIEWLDSHDPAYPFPPVETAMIEPNGLLAAGGDLNPKRLLRAYRRGIFPWYEQGQPILWWSPNPRAVLYPSQFRLTRSLRKSVRNKPYTVSFDQAFREVMLGCAGPRRGVTGTWITAEMLDAYCHLHAQGHAHSVEVWHAADGRLIGGLYGITVGRVFFGESMFSWATDASKIGFAYLARHLQAWDYPLIDCQLRSSHIDSLGAELSPRRQFMDALARLCTQPPHPSPWRVNPAFEVSSRRPDLTEQQPYRRA